MTIQTGVAVDVAYAAETVFGTKPAPAGGTLVRRIASTLALSRQTFRSNEIRPDAQLAAQRHGSRRVQGEIRGELAPAAWDDLLAAALRGTWTAGVSFAAAAGSGVTASDAGRSFTRAGGSWLADGFKIGDVVRWSGLSAGNDGRNLRIVDLTDATMTVAETVEAVATANEACACAVTGEKVATGTGQPSFTIEHHFAEAGFAQVFSGCRIGRMQLSLSPNRMAEVSFSVLGRDMEVREGADAPYFAAPATVSSRQPLGAIDATLRVAGADVGVVTGLDLSVDLGLVADAVVGAATVPDVVYGRTNVSGTMTAFVEDAALLKNYLASDEVALHLLLAPAGGAGFVSLHLPRLMFNGADLRIQGGEGLPLRLPFQALVRTDGGAGTAWDAATMTIQAAVD